MDSRRHFSTVCFQLSSATHSSSSSNIRLFCNLRRDNWKTVAPSESTRNAPRVQVFAAVPSSFGAGPDGERKLLGKVNVWPPAPSWQTTKLSCSPATGLVKFE